jgi:hypothetical protein
MGVFEPHCGPARQILDSLFLSADLSHRRCVPHAVVQKLVSTFLAKQEPGPYGRPKSRVQGILAPAVDEGQGSNVGERLGDPHWSRST